MNTTHQLINVMTIFEDKDSKIYEMMTIFEDKDYKIYENAKAMKWFNVFSHSQQTSLHVHHKSLAHYFPRAQYSHLGKLLQDTLFREHAKLWASFFHPLDFPRCRQTCPGHGQVHENSFSHTGVPFVFHAICKYDVRISFKHPELIYKEFYEMNQPQKYFKQMFMLDKKVFHLNLMVGQWYPK
jgi:hypothetical protein